MGTKDETLPAVAQNLGIVLNVLNGFLAGNAFLKSRKPYGVEEKEPYQGKNL